MFRMEYLVSRTAKDGITLWQYRREVPKPLRSILGCREIKHDQLARGSIVSGPIRTHRRSNHASLVL